MGHVEGNGGPYQVVNSLLAQRDLRDHAAVLTLHSHSNERDSARLTPKCPQVLTKFMSVTQRLERDSGVTQLILQLF